MFTRLATVVCLMVAVFTPAAPAAEPPKPEPNEDAKALAHANGRFALGLYRQLAKEEGNLFFSPYSISAALAMAYAGAEGQTKKEMAQVLHFDMPQQQLHTAFAAIQRKVHGTNAPSGIQLSVANRLWGQAGFPLQPQFQHTLRSAYGAELVQLDFVQQPEAARQTINGWVADRTQQKIQDLLPPGVLDAMTRLVLTNAVYFKGAWTEAFEKERTKDAPFYVSSREKISVPMMQQTHRFNYAAANNVQILELPYGKQRELAMIVLLPKDTDGLADLETQLTADTLQEWLAQLRSRKVNVLLPRFRLTAQFQLTDALQAMGMRRAFTPGEADFSGIATQEELVISAVIHKAFVDVNEQGTEAAAATGVAVAVTAAPVDDEPIVFRADHPFVFLIRDNRTGSVLFLGRVTNPKA